MRLVRGRRARLVVLVIRRGEVGGGRGGLPHHHRRRRRRRAPVELGARLLVLLLVLLVLLLMLLRRLLVLLVLLVLGITVHHGYGCAQLSRWRERGWAPVWRVASSGGPETRGSWTFKTLVQSWFLDAEVRKKKKREERERVKKRLNRN